MTTIGTSTPKITKRRLMSRLRTLDGERQADDSADGGVPVPQGQNLVRHARVASVETVASWEGDHEFLPLAARRGGARQETSPAVAPAQLPLQQGTFTAEQVEELCVRYAANETATLQQRLSHSERLLADSHRRETELGQSLQTAIDKVAATEAEIAQMSRELATLRLRIPAGGQQAVQQHPRAPTQNSAGLPPHQPPVAPRAPEMQQRRQPLNLGAQPFLQPRPALPAPSPPRQDEQQAKPLAPRRALPPPPAHGPAPRAMPTPQRLLPGAPGHADDVFDPSVPDSMPWRPANFEKRPVRELLDAAFLKVKGTVWTQPFLQIPKSRLPGERTFIGLCIQHIDRARMVYAMLNDLSRYHSLISGIINGLLVDKIFTQTALLNLPHDNDGYMAAFVTRYQAEKEIAYPNPVLNDFNRRWTITENRADAAKNLQRLPRFWKWIGERAHLIAEEITDQLNITITHNRRAYKDSLAQAANELLRIHVRMMQETSTYSLEFLGTGYAWVSDRMLNRDPTLRYQQLPDRNCPWVTQCTVTPLVTEEKLERTIGAESRVFINKETLLKAEVTLCERRGNLRQ